jgi:hypothetical protein
VGRATTDTLTNKTLSSPVVTGTVTAGGGVGTNGQVLTSTGTGVSWSNASAGTVTSVTAGTGLSGGTITSTGTIAIDSTVATLTGTQTLTNKTIDYNSNTITNLPSSNSITLLSTTNITSGTSTVSISGISSSYTNLMIEIIAYFQGESSLSLDFNSSGTDDATFNTTLSSGTSTQTIGGYQNGVKLTGGGTQPYNVKVSAKANWVVNVFNYSNNPTASFTYSGMFAENASDSLPVSVSGGGGKYTTGTISGLRLTASNTFGSSGTVKIYGVK